MEIREFAENVRKELLKRLKGIKGIQVTSVLKNNSIPHIGLMVERDKTKASPNTYMEEYFAMFQNGCAMADIIQRIEAVYNDSGLETDFDFKDIFCWEKVKLLVCFKMISTERNQELLEQIPHKNILDLSMVFYLSLADCNATILINNTHCEVWGIDVAILERAALENTPVICPMQLRSMKEVLKGMLPEDIPEEPKMYILSNEQQMYGAAVSFYPDALEKVSEQLRQDFYVLPSSLHEMLLLPVKENDNVEELVNMVCSVNASVLLPEEILGDKVYLYSRGSKELKLAA